MKLATCALGAAACVFFAAVARASEVDFVCSMTKAFNITCADCNQFCSGCGIVCNADGHITKLFVVHNQQRQQ